MCVYIYVCLGVYANVCVCTIISYNGNRFTE